MIITGDARRLSVDMFPQKYGVIVADPPWNFQAGGEKSVRNKYPLMKNQEIYDMPIEDLAFSDSVLLIWGVWAMLPEALKTIDAWGFKYITGMPWIKMTKNKLGLSFNTGFWLRGCSEYVLIAKRGRAKPPVENFIGFMSPNLEHSRKPETIHVYAEALPGPYIELFARRSRSGWDSFGNEVTDESGNVHTPTSVKVSPQRRLFNGC